MVSTPSRSRQATRISLPDIAGPTSARLLDDCVSAGEPVVPFEVADVVGLLMFLSGCGCRSGNEKTHDRFQPWVLVEIQFSKDKRRRRRLLQRRLPGRLVDYSLTLPQLYWQRAARVKRGVQKSGCRCTPAIQVKSRRDVREQPSPRPSPIRWER